MTSQNQEIARSTAEALARGDMEGFLGHYADDVVLHFPGRGPMAGDYRGKGELAKLFERQMEVLDAPPEMEIHDVLASDDHAVVMNNTRATRGGKTLEQGQIVVMHLRDGKISEVWLHFSKQHEMDELASS